MARDAITPEEAGLLGQLGLRVRRARAARGLSRRALEERSGVSERYLAQLESGRGNASILLLNRIAVALGTDLADLLAPPADLARRGRVALLGLDPAARHDCAIALGERLGVSVFHVDVAATAPNGGAAAVQRADAEAEIAAFAGLVETHARCVFSIGEALLVEPRAWRLFRTRCFTLWLKAGTAPRVTPEEAAASDTAQAFDGIAAVDTHSAGSEPGGSDPASAPREQERKPDHRALERIVDALSSRTDLVVDLTGRDPVAWMDAILPMIAEVPLVAAGVPVPVVTEIATPGGDEPD